MLGAAQASLIGQAAAGGALVEAGLIHNRDIVQAVGHSQNDPIDFIEDLTASNAHLVQTNSEWKPLYQAGAYPAVRFDGINDYLENTNPALDINGNYTLIMLVAVPKQQLTSVYSQGGSGSGTYPWFSLNEHFNQIGWLDVAYDSGSETGKLTNEIFFGGVGDYEKMVIAIQRTPSGFVIRKNDVLVSMDAFNPSLPSPTWAREVYGAMVRGTDRRQFHALDFMADAGYNRVLAAEELTTNYNFFAALGGVS